MSRVTPELAELVDLFCEGDASSEQAARLEALVAQSDEARQYLLDCFQIHCELAWELRQQSEDVSQADPSNAVAYPYSRSSEPKGKQRRVWKFAALAAALLVAVALGLTSVVRRGNPKHESHPYPSVVARIEQVKDVRWGDTTAPAIHAPLPAGGKLAFQQGLLEVVFQSGARVIFQGPAEVELPSPSSVVLLRGKLTAEVPAAARGFAVHTPNSTVVDLGTRFGVACRAGQTDVEVFAGSVLLRLNEAPPGSSPQERPLLAQSAVRVSGVTGQGAVKIEPLAAGSEHFVQTLTGSTALLQALVENDPHLIHFYPFEGATSAERLRDRRGNLDLHEVTMREGDGGGTLQFARNGPDPSTQVVVPFRAERFGGTHGRGLQSAAIFQPPAAMTVELLLYLSRVDKNPEGFITCAVATRNDSRHCGFLVTAIRDGELAWLFDGGAEWLPSGFKFAPGRWYYVADTFRVRNAKTEVNAFAADLSDKGPKLSWIVRNRMAPGVPACGPLGIGKGFDGQMAGAYPWAGQLGQIAIYDTLLDRQTLDSHFRALLPHASVQPASVVSK